MSDTPVPMVGPVYGFRTWRADADSEHRWTGNSAPRLRSSMRGTVWDEPIQHAECNPYADPFSVMAMYRRYYPHDRIAEHEPASDPRCWCGLYAHSTLGRCLEEKNLALRLNHRTMETRREVLGLVRAWGKMHAADRGFRAAHMAVDTLVCLRHKSSTPFVWGHQQHVHDIAAGLGVTVVCIKKDGVVSMRRQFERAFAGREGVYLWRKEAPWTSDVTSRPTKSSTPRPSGIRSAIDPTHEWQRLGDPLIVQAPKMSGKQSLVDSVESTFRLADEFDTEGGGAA